MSYTHTNFYIVYTISVIYYVFLGGGGRSQSDRASAESYTGVFIIGVLME